LHLPTLCNSRPSEHLVNCPLALLHPSGPPLRVVSLTLASSRSLQLDPEPPSPAPLCTPWQGAESLLTEVDLRGMEYPVLLGGGGGVAIGEGRLWGEERGGQGVDPTRLGLGRGTSGRRSSMSGPGESGSSPLPPSQGAEACLAMVQMVMAWHRCGFLKRTALYDVQADGPDADRGDLRDCVPNNDPVRSGGGYGCSIAVWTRRISSGSQRRSSA
jgi:hypothetical protein